jgi:hypothetical protein
MEFNLESPDIQCALRSQHPVMVGQVPVNHISFSKMTSPNIGFTAYNHLLNLMCFSSENAKALFGETGETSVFKSMLIKAKNDDTFGFLFSEACKLFFGKEPAIDLKYNRALFFSQDKFICVKCKSLFSEPAEYKDKPKSREPAKVGCPFCRGEYARPIEFEINEDNFQNVVDVIKIRNGIKNRSDEESGNPANELTKQLIEKRNKMRKKIAAEKNNSEGITLWELIDIYVSISKKTYEEVMQYDVFQFDTQFVRTRMYDEYQVDIQAAVHGAKSEDSKLKHWLRKIDNKENSDDD